MPTTTLKPEEVVILKGFLEEFRNAPKSDKKQVVKNATRALTKCMPDLDKEHKQNIYKACRASFAVSPPLILIIESETLVV